MTQIMNNCVVAALLDFRQLHERQAGTTLLAVCLPPRERGIT